MNHHLSNTIQKYYDLLIMWGMCLLFLGANSTSVLDFYLPVFAFFFLVWAPGYLLSSALFFDTNRLLHIEKITLNIVFSLFQITATCLILNFSKIAINETNLVIGLITQMMILTLICIYRRSQKQNNIHPVKLQMSISTSWKAASLMLFAFVGILLFINFIGSERNGEKFTEFYIRPLTETRESTKTISSQNAALEITVKNQEQQKQQYRVDIIGTTYTNSIDIGWLENNEQKNIIIPLDETLKSQASLSFKLYSSKQSAQPYRELHIWLTNVQQ
jgi:uncharacterized membrane protein